MNTVTLPLNLPSEALELSRSELVELIGRGVIPLHPDALSVEEKALLGKH